MKKTHKTLLAGVTAMTPAFALAPEIAHARSVEPAAIETVQDAVRATEADKAALKDALLALTTAEKLRIGGDRIRILKDKPLVQTAFCSWVYRYTYNRVNCSGMLFAWA